MTMTTPILMLLLMTAPWAVAWAWNRRGAGPRLDPAGAAATGMALLFLFTASGHFLQTDAMVSMLPDWVPGRVALVQATGVLELAMAAGFAWPRTRRATGWLGIAVLVLFFPANVHAALTHAPMGGHAWGPVYLLVRAPLQLAIVWWTWRFVLQAPHAPSRREAAWAR
jgi:uncharacterized membrane protein